MAAGIESINLVNISFDCEVKRHKSELDDDDDEDEDDDDGDDYDDDDDDDDDEDDDPTEEFSDLDIEYKI